MGSSPYKSRAVILGRLRQTAAYPAALRILQHTSPGDTSAAGATIGGIMAIAKSGWCDQPLQLTGTLDAARWASAVPMDMPGIGPILLQNDAHFLYLGIDAQSDTGNDAGTGDYFWLTFDVDKNKAITPNVDVDYGTYPNQPNRIGKQFYLGAGQWTGIQANSGPCECRMGFGQSPQSSTPHRMWEIKVPLADIGGSLAATPPRVFMGLRVSSTTPPKTVDFPVGFSSNFSALTEVTLATQSLVAIAGQGPIVGVIGLVPTTLIDASGRASTASTYVPFVQQAAFGGTLNFLFNRVNYSSAYNSGGGAFRYKVWHTDRQASTGEQPLRIGWSNYRWNGTAWDLKQFTSGANDVYAGVAPGDEYSTKDLLFQVNSPGLRLSTGLHDFRVAIVDANGNALQQQTITIRVDNTLPEAWITKIETADGAAIQPCQIVNLAAGKLPLKISYHVWDPDQNLLSLSVNAAWGHGAGQTLYTDSFANRPAPWSGPRDAATSPANFPTVTCAYQFTVVASKRVTNGYSYLGTYSSDSVSATLQLATTVPLLPVVKTTIAPLGKVLSDVHPTVVPVD